MRGKVVDQRFLVSWAVAMVIWFGGAFLINTQIVDYSMPAHYMRPWDQELRLYWIMIVADFMFTAGVVWFYARLVERGPWLMRGVVFGLRVALLTAVPFFMRNYTVYPAPPKLLIQQCVGFAVLLMLIGAAVAFLYRHGRAPYRGTAA